MATSPDFETYLVPTGCEMAEYVFDPTKIFPFIARDELDENWKGIRKLFMRAWVTNNRPSNRRWRNAATQAGPVTRYHSTKDDNYVDLVRICYCFIAFVFVLIIAFVLIDGYLLFCLFVWIAG